MTPAVDDFLYLINSILLGEEPTVEDFILLIGTCVAFIAFILWCCFPIAPKDPGLIPSHSHIQYEETRDKERDRYTYAHHSKTDRDFLDDD